MPEEFEPLHADKLTWSVLLGRWVAFAKQAVGLPDSAEGKRVRDSVPDVIMLQAVWFALKHMDELDEQQRRLGIDRAGVLVERHATILERRYARQPMPESMRELIADARQQLQEAAGEPSD